VATDATGTPTAKGIPKYNTANDAPSGLGFNAAMDAIDTLLDSYVGKPSGIVSGEAVVWNGSAWVRSSVTRIGVGSLGSGTPDSTKFLRGDGAWATAGGATLETALPGSPTDGQEIVLVDSTSAPTYSWHLRYVSAKASNKWIFVGGAPGFSAVDTSEATSSTTYVALTTAGPSFTVPVAGDYLVEIACHFTNASSSGVLMSYDIGATGAVDGDAARGSTNNPVSGGVPIISIRKKSGLAASTALVSKYRAASAVSNSFFNRVMIVTPIALGG
jgi:hypothetical protein